MVCFAMGIDINHEALNVSYRSLAGEGVIARTKISSICKKT